MRPDFWFSYDRNPRDSIVLPPFIVCKPYYQFSEAVKHFEFTEEKLIITLKHIVVMS